MPRVRWQDGRITEVGQWTEWFEYQGSQIKLMNDGSWDHCLESHLSESDPNANHIHYKYKTDSGGRTHSHVLCAVKIDGMREINRRELIDSINLATGLGLSYR